MQAMAIIAISVQLDLHDSIMFTDLKHDINSSTFHMHIWAIPYEYNVIKWSYRSYVLWSYGVSGH